MIGKLKKYAYEVLVIGSVIVLLVLALANKLRGKSGTWAKYVIDYKDSGNEAKGRNDETNRKKESSGEAKCRAVLEQIFNKPFPSTRPDFLSNPVTGGSHNLELDCYNKELKLAIEYNGIQHYKYVPFFHKNKEVFMNQKYRDDMKRRMCKDNGIVLIEVPYTVKINDIYGYLRNKLSSYNYI